MIDYNSAHLLAKVKLQCYCLVWAEPCIWGIEGGESRNLEKQVLQRWGVSREEGRWEMKCHKTKSRDLGDSGCKCGIQIPCNNLYCELLLDSLILSSVLKGKAVLSYIFWAWLENQFSVIETWKLYGLSINVGWVCNTWSQQVNHFGWYYWYLSWDLDDHGNRSQINNRGLLCLHWLLHYQSPLHGCLRAIAALRDYCCHYCLGTDPNSFTGNHDAQKFIILNYKFQELRWLNSIKYKVIAETGVSAIRKSLERFDRLSDCAIESKIEYCLYAGLRRYQSSNGTEDLYCQNCIDNWSGSIVRFRRRSSYLDLICPNYCDQISLWYQKWGYIVEIERDEAWNNPSSDKRLIVFKAWTIASHTCGPRGEFLRDWLIWYVVGYGGDRRSSDYIAKALT